MTILLFSILIWNSTVVHVYKLLMQSAVLCLCKVILSEKQLTGELLLTGSDSTAGNSRLPRCEDLAKIGLISYYYRKIGCSVGESCRTFLSSAAEVVLYRMCSMRKACYNSTFPLIDSLEPHMYKLMVHYQCFDLFVTFLDICSNTTKAGDKVVHLMSSDSLKNSKQCQCSIQGDGFSLLLNDIRLTASTSSSERTCAPVTLEILQREYPCNSEEGFFNIQIQMTSTIANISLRSTYRDVLPEMIWIQVQSKEAFTITCDSINWERLEKPTTAGFTIEPLSGRDLLDDPRINVVVGVGFVVVIWIAVFIVCLKRKRREAQSIRTKTDSVERKRGKHRKKEIGDIKAQEMEPLEENKTSESNHKIDPQKTKLNIRANTHSDVRSHRASFDKVLVNENVQMELSGIR